MLVVVVEDERGPGSTVGATEVEAFYLGLGVRVIGVSGICSD